MDKSDATKILVERIEKLEPELSTKIMGWILWKEKGEEIIRLAYAPEQVLENLVQKTKLKILTNPPISLPISSSRPINPLGNYSSSPAYQVQHQILNSEFGGTFRDSSLEDYGVLPQNPGQFMGYEDVFYEETGFGRKNRPTAKNCIYYKQGSCKHGESCRYLHGPDNNFSPVFSNHDLRADDHLFLPGSLEKLDVEISDLLKSTNSPISIASLPSLYCEKYGRTLQAEGYLTESQRHGRAGYSLTKLLARLKTIRLVDRPHGQHAVILAEEAYKYNGENRNERNDPGSADSGSSARQIYMTFPAESTFTEEDVSEYFGEYGTVVDVRMPCQPKRMYGFVTFSCADTVQTILEKRNPHYVRGSRVLVKPYRDKAKLDERKHMDKNNDYGMFYRRHYLDFEPDFHPMAPRFIRKHMMEKALEMKRRHFSGLQFERPNIHNRQFYGYRMADQYSLADAYGFSNIGQYRYLFDAVNNGSVSNDRSQHLGTEYTAQESQVINLPENPFMPAIGSGISAVN